MTEATLLEDRGVLRLSGPDRVAFLQGLVSNDVARVAPARVLWAAFLTAQGKYLHDFFLVAAGESLLLEGEAGRLDDLLRRLKLYRLRSKVELADATIDYAVAALWGADALARLGLPADPGAAAPFAGGIAYVDPRRSTLGARAILPRAAAAAALAEAGFAAAPRDGYDRLRLGEGVPDGSRDLVPEKSILLENGFDELAGVDWDKGCWMGQELTARTKYRALIKRRLLPVTLEGAVPPSGSPVLQGEREVGELRSTCDGQGLALLRLDALAAGAPLRVGQAQAVVHLPAWIRLPPES